MASNHTWNFFRAGGFDQVRLDTGADLMASSVLKVHMSFKEEGSTDGE